MKKKRIILGIDPGTSFTGYGIIASSNNTPELLSYGYLDLSKISDNYEKLSKIFTRTLSVIDEFKPNEFAVEAPFYGKNVQSMLKLGRAQGVAMSAALYRALPVFEYSPRKIKLAVTGNGAASKEQVAAFLEKSMNFQISTKKLDVTDGIAVAVCHFYQNRFGGTEKKAGSWKEFIKQNPGRLKRK